MIAYIPATDSFEKLELSGEAMTVYLHGARHYHKIHVCPASSGATSETFYSGKNPRHFIIHFVGGKAAVAPELGRFMVDCGLAKASPIMECA